MTTIFICWINPFTTLIVEICEFLYNWVMTHKNSCVVLNCSILYIISHVLIYGIFNSNSEIKTTIRPALFAPDVLLLDVHAMQCLTTDHQALATNLMVYFLYYFPIDPWGILFIFLQCGLPTTYSALFCYPRSNFSPISNYSSRNYISESLQLA